MLIHGHIELPLNFLCISLKEFIAVGQLSGSVQGKILCFTGPPGLSHNSLLRYFVLCNEEIHTFNGLLNVICL